MLVAFWKRERDRRELSDKLISTYVLVTFPVALYVWPAPNSIIAACKRWHYCLCDISSVAQDGIYTVMWWEWSIYNFTAISLLGIHCSLRFPCFGCKGEGCTEKHTRWDKRDDPRCVNTKHKRLGTLGR